MLHPLTEADLEAECEADLEAEFVCVEPLDDIDRIELRAARLAILLEFYRQDEDKQGWHNQDPWASRMPTIPSPEAA